MAPTLPDPIMLPPMPWWLDLVTILPLIVGVAFVVYIGRHARKGWGLLERQTDFLDSQKAMNAKALEQNQSIEEMIAKQYAETNERSDRALAQSAEALKLHAAALEQLTRMNETIARMAGAIGKPERPANPGPAG